MFIILKLLNDGTRQVFLLLDVNVMHVQRIILIQSLTN